MPSPLALLERTGLVRPPMNGAEPAPPWSGKQWSVLLVLLVAGVVAAWVGRVPGLTVGPDDSTFLLLSESLASGRYHNEFLLGTPPHAQYPPGMPAWLLLISTIGGGIGAFIAVNCGLLAITALFVGDALRRLGFAWTGVAAAGSIVLNPTLSGLAGTLYSETLFITLSTVALWALLRADLDNQRHARRWASIAIVLALLAFSVRTIGVALIAAVFLTLVIRRRWRWALAAAATSSLVVGGWFGYVTQVSGQTERSYVADLAGSPLSSVTGGFLGRIGHHLQFYIVEGLPSLFGLTMIPGTPIDNLLWTILFFGGGAWGLYWLWKHWPAAVASFLATGAVLLLWPWAIPRLAAPLIPVGIGAVLIGAGRVGMLHEGLALRRITLGGVTSILLLCSVQRHIDRSVARRECAPDFVAATRSGCMFVQDRALLEATRVVREQLPSSAVVAASKESTVYSWGGHRVVSIYQLDHDFDDVVEEIQRIGATHLLLARMYPWEGERLGTRLKAVCDQLVEVGRVDAPAVVLAPRQAGDPDACGAIERVLEWEIPEL